MAAGRLTQEFTPVPRGNPTRVPAWPNRPIRSGKLDGAFRCAVNSMNRRISGPL